MSLPLSSNLPLKTSSSGGLGSGIGRAQNFSTSRLNYRKDIDKAKVSINSVMNSQKTLMKKQFVSGDDTVSNPLLSMSASSNNGPTTSVSHSGSVQAATTSISHPGAIVNEGDKLSDEQRDEIRYNLAQRHLMAKRKEQEAEEAAKMAQANEHDVFDLGFKTGRGFRTHGKYGLLRKMYHLRKTKPLAYKHWDHEDRVYLKDLVKPHLTNVSRGTSIGYALRRKMKYQVERDRRAGKIDVYTSRDIKKIINDLPG